MLTTLGKLGLEPWILTFLGAVIFVLSTVLVLIWIQQRRNLIREELSQALLWMLRNKIHGGDIIIVGSDTEDQVVLLVEQEPRTIRRPSGFVNDGSTKALCRKSLRCRLSERGMLVVRKDDAENRHSYEASKVIYNMQKRIYGDPVHRPALSPLQHIVREKAKKAALATST